MRRAWWEHDVLLLGYLLFWNGFLSMQVRAQVLHTICDGSPAHLEDRVADALESFNRDPDKKIRRQAHKVRWSPLHATGEV